MILVLGLWGLPSFSQFNYDLGYYLPDFTVENEDIPEPREIIGHEVGEWHVSHDKLVQYMYALAEASDRISIQTMGRTHEAREQVLLIITSEKNQRRLEEIRKDHLALSDPEEDSRAEIGDMPVVIWQGFSIHGNEPSGANAALAVAYYYAAGSNPKLKEQLENAVILFDPAFNPDGIQRFASWVNSSRAMNLVADPQNREQNETWPGGRTNHYWFDLNRDWLPVQQPESRNRIHLYHEWKPNILTDHHEMGTNNTFFFQPGIPSRNNPNTPERNFQLTERIGEFHAKALDAIGSLYFSKESYDDFYYGKGSTFPDINGGIGILFEQASSRGHRQESENGVLTFPFTIRNQVRTALSTLEAGVELREELLTYQQEFFEDALKEAEKDEHGGIVFGSPKDRESAKSLLTLMGRHGIEARPLEEDLEANGRRYPKESSYVIPFEQPQYRLIKIMIEEPTRFPDSLFYDVSAWTLPHAFNLDFDYLDPSTLRKIPLGNAFDGRYDPAKDLEKSDYAYIISWEDYYSPWMLNWLQERGILTKVSEASFQVGEDSFAPGSIIVPVQRQSQSPAELYGTMKALERITYIDILGVSSGNTGGIMLGSPQVETVKAPKVALIVEGGVKAYDAGEVWHLLDQRYEMEVTLIPMRNMGYANLDSYNTLIMVDGSYGALSKASIAKIKRWVAKGGNIIACKRANEWLASQEIISVAFDDYESDTTGREDYEDLRNIRGAQVTGGAIFEADLDISHPLGYGYPDRSLPVFVNTNTYIKAPPNPFAYPLRFGDDPLLSGYISEENLQRIRNKAGIIVSRYGRGKIVSFGFNPNFRAFWYGTNKVFMNAIFFADLISSQASLGE